MADLSDLKTNSDFQGLAPDQRRIVVDTLAPKTEGFRDLDPVEQAKVKLYFMQLGSTPQAPAFPAEGSVFESWPESLTRRAVQSVLPTLGQIGGGLAGGAIASPSIAGVPAGVLGGEMAGGALGELGNQALGLTKPSMAHVAASGLAAPAGRATGALLGGATRRAVGFLPGSGAGAQEVGIAAGRSLEGQLSPNIPANTLYDVVRTMNPGIPLKNTQAMAARLAEEDTLPKAFADLVEGGTIQTQYGQMPGKLQGAMPFQDLWAKMQELGALQRRLGEGKEQGAAKALLGSMYKDLDAAAQAGGTGSLAEGTRAALSAANLALRKEKASALFDTAVEKAITTPAGGGAVQQINAGKLLDFLRTNQRFTSTYSEDELAPIRETLTWMNTLPRTAPAAFGRLRAAGAAVSLSLGHVLPALGLEAPEIISMALQSAPGRAALRHLYAQGGGALDHQAMGILAQIVTSQTAQRATSASAYEAVSP